MTPGSRSRRIAVGTAVWTMAALSGCHGVPVPRLLGPPPIPNQSLGAGARAALLPATVALDVPTEMAAIDPRNSATGTLTRASALGESPRASLISTESTPPSPAEPLPATPLLDAALIQAKNHSEQPTPSVEPVVPASAPSVSSLATSTTLEVAPVAPDPLVMPASIPLPSSLSTPTPTPAPTPEPKPVEVAAAPVSPEELWREGVRKLVGLARAKQEQGGSGGTEPWGLRARVLAWLAEPDIDPDLGGRDPDGVRAVLHALEAGESRGTGESHLRGDDVRTAIQTLQAKAPLELVDLQICQGINGFGDVVPFDKPGHRAGEWIKIYCEVDGLSHEVTPNGYQTRLAGRMEIIPAAGGPTLALPLGTAEEVFPRRRRDYFVGYVKEIPRSLAPGQYTVRITLHDVFSDRSASRTAALAIIGDAAPTP